MKDVFALLTIGLALLVLLFGSVGGVSYLYERDVGCPHFAAAVERPFRYDFLGGGCFVQDAHGQWVQRENYWNNVSGRQ